MNSKRIYLSVLYTLLMLGSSSFVAHARPLDSNYSANEKIVSVYLLLDKPQQLQQYVEDLAKLKKPNFNRVIFSFVRPTLIDYQTGSLADTGLLGYFTDHDGKGAQAFNALKAAIKLSEEKNIQTFLSVGGWNYSCNFEIAKDACGPHSSAANRIFYDWFPDPTDRDQASKAKTSYANLVKLANDLGVDGLDIDYEEFWHADEYAVTWGPSSSGEWSTGIAQQIIDSGGPTYKNLIEYGTHSGSSFVMPKTIDKLDAILHAIIDDPGAKYLKFATAAPPVGARPITGFVYGDKYPDIYTKGGLWWKGNLKGLWYNLTNKDAAIVSHFDSLGLMTYDLCSDIPSVCEPYAGGPLDLTGQVNAYMKDYTNWLQAQCASKPSLTIDNIGKVTFLPAKYHINAKIQFGFEVNQPAYPKNINGQLQLTNQLVNKILDAQKDSGGVIIWEMYSKQNTAVPDATTVKYTINQSCKTFLAHDPRYDCNADFPSTPK
ncbi:glycoside hydrolase family 18 protein [Fluoribacter dumoffii]|uniref:glycoside hydrolase family 18 protein n=1 Tax=Fluoribacter dumoffii TaxID=463 RepID=UPI00026C76E8|nr:glycoside hydrolase family 18 protein [Fluoribacter dumoffii]MCW8418605.1 glycoside hydrolase family 18 protein [Fluoribacter dumoffii]MCW8453551.1 glycoside hydrolase family 18 protein [Fluoribacter dumoffii]MCW8459230.1 glycoside hydrolase family 18 protein [Fluoribacter dumoffii]MCW8482589.1 glycoside hydrolase family 18 protein [Fluoribacter dumoffii]